MPLFDLDLDELRGHVTDMAAPPDLDDFWTQTIDAARVQSRPAAYVAQPGPLRSVNVFDVTFSGYGGRPVKAWLLLPTARGGPVDCVVQFVGYGGGRGRPNQWLTWPATGRAAFVMDNRGQGGDSYQGDTADLAVQDVHAAGYVTHGVLDPRDYYYRRLYTDAVLAVEAAAAHPAISRVVVAGPSQGGGLTIAAASLSTLPVAALPDVPFLCDMRRASRISAQAPYTELAGYLRTHPHREEQVFATLGYFDGAVLAVRARMPALFSVGLMDDVCPASTVFAAHNAWAGPKRIDVYTYAGHEGGGPVHLDRQLDQVERWLAGTGPDEPGSGA